MKLGVKKSVITPRAGVRMAGFNIPPDRKVEGVHDDLMLEVMVLEDKGKRAAVVCADIIGFDLQITQQLRKTLHSRFGFGEDEVLFNASHTHSGPQTLTTMLNIKAEEAYLDFLHNTLYASIEEAIEDMEEVEAYQGRTSSSISINRRLMSDGEVLFAPNPEGIIDDEVIVLKFCCGDRVKAVLFNFACHPSTMNTQFVSADYPGAARRTIEEFYGKGTVAFFLQGCGANAKVRVLDGDRFRRGTWEDVDILGRSLGESVLCACRDSMERIEDIKLSTQVSFIRLPFTPLPPKAYLRQLSLEDASFKKMWADKMLENYAGLPQDALFMLQRISINDKTMIVGMSGEVCMEYGLFAKSLLKDSVLMAAGYSNGTVGYIPTAVMFDEGGYEPESFLYFSFPSQYDRSVEKLVKQAISAITA